jgi:TonB family protein
MIKLTLAAMAAFAICAVCSAEDKGRCPSGLSTNMSAPKQAAVPVFSDPNKKYLGTVTLLAAISDKGYVCSTQVIRSISKELDKKAETAVREWHFEPARRKGHTVPLAVLVEVNYWTTKTGEIVSDSPKL